MSSVQAYRTQGIVYLVDDEAIVRDALGFLLRSRGLMVHAFDGAEALLTFLAREPRPLCGVFVLDVRMVPMSGLLLHEALILQGLTNPVILFERPRRHSHGGRGAQEGRF